MSQENPYPGDLGLDFGFYWPIQNARQGRPTSVQTRAEKERGRDSCWPERLYQTDSNEHSDAEQVDENLLNIDLYLDQNALLERHEIEQLQPRHNAYMHEHKAEGSARRKNGSTCGLELDKATYM